MRQNIELHIEEFILHGFPPCDRYRIVQVFQNEMIRLFSEQDMQFSLSRDREFTRIDSGNFEIDRKAKPEIIGSKVAQTIHGALNK